MFLKNVLAASMATALLAWSGPSIADQYRAGEFFNLDLSKAVLSPKPLGPAAQFAPFPVEAGTDHEGVAPRASAEPEAVPGKIALHNRVAHFGVKKRKGAARTKLAHRHGNPLDAQASDTRIQVWPCKSGGICDWHRPVPGH
jgi:hypothetical protein